MSVENADRSHIHTSAHPHIGTLAHSASTHRHIRTSAHLIRFVSVAQSPLIRKFISAVLLLVFLLSAAPKAYFHDAVAGHKDQPVSCKHVDRNATCVHESHMNCHFDQLVVTSVFHFQALDLYPVLLNNAVSDYSQYAENPVSGRSTSPDGRGPPMA
jgi:hypothetical protein